MKMLLDKLFVLPFVAQFASAVAVALDPSTQVPNDSAAAAASSCSEWYELYGEGSWTYTQVQWCFEQRGSSTVLTQEQKDAQYYWGDAWYADDGRELTWRTYGTVLGRPDFDSGEISSIGPAKKDIYTYNTKFSAGTYDVHLNYYQECPYWGADATINADVRFKVSLGR